MNKREARIRIPPSFSSVARRTGPWVLKLVRMGVCLFAPLFGYTLTGQRKASPI